MCRNSEQGVDPFRSCASPIPISGYSKPGGPINGAMNESGRLREQYGSLVGFLEDEHELGRTLHVDQLCIHIH